MKTPIKSRHHPKALSGIKVLIFDLDGTLVNAYKAVASSLNYAFKRAGFPPIDDAVIKRSVGWGDLHLIRRFVPNADVDKILQIYRRHHLYSLKTGTRFLPGARKLIDDLKKHGYKLAIASNRPTRFSLIILETLKVRGHFDIVLCADKVKRAKPAPDILLELLKRFNKKSSEVLYVGDMMIDIQTGKRAHVKTIAVSTGSCTLQELKSLKPFKVIKKISELRPILNEGL